MGSRSTRLGSLVLVVRLSPRRLDALKARTLPPWCAGLPIFVPGGQGASTSVTLAFSLTPFELVPTEISGAL